MVVVHRDFVLFCGCCMVVVCLLSGCCVVVAWLLCGCCMVVVWLLHGCCVLVVFLLCAGYVVVFDVSGAFISASSVKFPKLLKTGLTLKSSLHSLQLPVVGCMHSFEIHLMYRYHLLT